MSHNLAERNLLFGFVALQNSFISHEQFIAAVRLWLHDKQTPLDEILCDRQALARDEQQLIRGLVQKHLERHDNDAEKSLAVLSTVGSIIEELKQLGDADIDATLTHVPRPTRRHDDALGSAANVGSSTSAGLRFRILRQHAKGGLGEVFVAEDTELRREVALKEIQPRFADDPQCRNRFVVEAEITGGLEHPGIVPVYGLGQYDNGRPFYAMRFVRGDSLKEAVDRFYNPTRPPLVKGRSEDGLGKGKSEETFGDGRSENDLSKGRSEETLPVAGYGHGSRPGSEKPDYTGLEFRKLLGRFIDVCNAIEYAHSRGVLHRDLKPGNIMLGKYGETLVVDWGLAKVIGRDGGLQGDGARISARSFVGENAPTEYGRALGTPAFMPPEQAAGEIDRLGPASDVYSLGATLYYVLTGRIPVVGKSSNEVLEKVRAGEFPAPRAINGGVPKALDAICRRAMAKNPEDRYASPRELADDVERNLADEPVSCYVEPITTKLRRWGWRHRTLVSAAVVGLVASVVLLAVVSVLLDQKRRAVEAEQAVTEQRRQEAVAAKTRAELAEADAKQQRDIAREAESAAKESEADTIAFSEFLVADVLAVARPKGEQGGLGIDVTVKAALEEALKVIDVRFRDRPRAEAIARHALGVTFRLLGNLPVAESQLRAAVALRQRVLGDEHSDTLKSQNSLAVLLNQAGKSNEAILLYETIMAQYEKSPDADKLALLTTMSNLAISLQDAGRVSEAVPLLERVKKGREAELGPNHKETLVSISNLAVAYRECGRKSEAAAMLQETLAKSLLFGLLEGDSDDAGRLTIVNNLAVLHEDLGKQDEAIVLLEHHLSVVKKKFGADHPTTLLTQSNLGSAYRRADRLDDGIRLLEETLRRQKATLGDAHPDVLATMNYLAETYRQADRSKDAIALYKEALRLWKETPEPEHPDRYVTLHNLAVAYDQSGLYDESLALHEETFAWFKKNLGPDHERTLASQNGLASIYLEVNKVAESCALYEDSLRQHRQSLGSDHPETITTMHALGEAYIRARRPTDAIPVCEEALRRQRERFSTDHQAVLVEMNNLAAAYHGAGRSDDAIAQLLDAIPRMKLTLGAHHRETINSIYNLATAYRDTKQFAKAIELYRDNLELLRQTRGALDAETLATLNNLAECCMDAHDYDQAEQALSELVEAKRSAYGPEHFNTIVSTAFLGHCLLRQGKFQQAEPILRVCLPILQQQQPNGLLRYVAASMLGESLARQKNFAEAEPLLLEGYQGLHDRRENIPPQGKVYVVEAVQRLIDLYTMLEKPDEAVKWKTRLNELSTDTRDEE